jgi:hypothetical protein
MCNIMTTTTLNFKAAAEEFAEAVRDAGLFDEKSFAVVEDDGDGWNLVFAHNGCEIKVNVSEYWMFPNEVSYFVNVSHPNGNFMCQVGTNRPMRAAIDLGEALHFANVSGDPIQSEEF